MQGKGFRDGIQDFENKNAVILGISFDSVEDNAAFAEKFEFPYRLLSDPERVIGVAYHAVAPGEQKNAKRITYVIGPEGTITQAYEKVNVQTHAADILAAL